MPAAAKTFYGDLYLGFKLGTIASLPGAMDFSSMLRVMTSKPSLPFRGKVYYQDGVTRLDLDLPSLGTLTPAGVSGEPQGFMTFSLLLDQQSGDFVLLHHSARKAYRLTMPPELAELALPTDPMEVLTSKKFIEAFAEGGLRHVSTKRLRSRRFDGLEANGIEIAFEVEIPAEDLTEMREYGVEFDAKFKLRLFLEKDSNFPLLYELDSTMFSVRFELVNLQRDRLPEVLFEIPSFYTVEEYSLDDIESLLDVAMRDLAGLAGTLNLPAEGQAEPEAAETASSSPPPVDLSEEAESAGEGDTAEGS